MHDMRFNNPPNPEKLPEQIVGSGSVAKKSGKGFASFLKTLLKVLVVLALLYGAIIGSKYFINKKSNNLVLNYSAVFLSNGQVYFGKIIDKNDQELTLKEVCYLQNANSDFSPEAIQGSGFTLVKLGQELHGPEDIMHVNRSQILFYEYLRDDSQLVKTIENYK